MQVLLINQNATIERLVSLSCNKLGYGLSKSPDIASVEHDDYGFVIIDKEVYSEDEFSIVKDNFPSANYLIILPKTTAKPDGFDYSVEKPFLPTELVDILQNSTSKDSFVQNDDFLQSNDLDDLIENEEGTAGKDSPVANFDSEEFDIDSELEPLPGDDLLGDIDETLDATDDMDLDELDAGIDDTDTLLDDIQLDDISTDDLGVEDMGLDDLDIELGDVGVLDSDDESLDELDMAMPSEETKTLLDESADIDEDMEMPSFENIEHEENVSDDLLGAMDDLDMDEEESVAAPIDEDILDEDMPSLDDMSDEQLSLDDDLEVLDMDDELLDMDMEEAAVPQEEFVQEEFTQNEENLEQPLLPKDEELEDQKECDELPPLFNEDEVSELKNLLENDDTLEIIRPHREPEDDFDAHIKISNDELGSLTEESLAEALGVSLDDTDANAIEDEMNLFDSEHEEQSQQPTQNKEVVAASTQSLGLTDGQNIVLSLDMLKQLLEGMNISINITLSKK